MISTREPASLFYRIKLESFNISHSSKSHRVDFTKRRKRRKSISSVILWKVRALYRQAGRK